jgi:hypothetical protein
MLLMECNELTQILTPSDVVHVFTSTFRRVLTKSEFVTSNEIPRIVAHRCVIEASIGEQPSRNNYMGSLQGQRNLTMQEQPLHGEKSQACWPVDAMQVCF